MASFKCPSCSDSFRWVPAGTQDVGRDSTGRMLRVEAAPCPTCDNWSLQLIARTLYSQTGVDSDPVLIWPRATNRSSCPPEVPADICGDYREACLVLADSPKASAALSRRCLQQILRDGAKVEPGDLIKEIKQVVDSKRLPTTISHNLDVVRHIGNFAAHPTKSQSTGEIIDVELGEAEWNLDVIEALMDVYYVQPIRLNEKRAALNEKLAEAGKPQLPTPTES